MRQKNTFKTLCDIDYEAPSCLVVEFKGRKIICASQTADTGTVWRKEEEEDF